MRAGAPVRRCGTCDGLRIYVYVVRQARPLVIYLDNVYLSK